jgi:UDP-3-O-[3-hydroxymyristoyl] glucosamine N-acyltransferase
MGYISPKAEIGSVPESRDLIWDYHDGVPVVFHEPLIDPSAIVDAFCTVDAGTESPTTIGEHSWLQKRVHVAHDVKIGDNCEICVGVTLCGFVTIGDDVRIGGNTWIKPRITVGDGVRIGGGSVVVKDVPAGETWVGNPARKLERKTQHYQYPRAAHGEAVDWDTHAHFAGP